MAPGGNINSCTPNDNLDLFSGQISQYFSPCQPPLRLLFGLEPIRMSTGVQGSRFTFLDVGMTILKLKQRLTIGSSHYLSGLPVHTQYGVAVHP